jgi:hypothetical protein
VSPQEYAKAIVAGVTAGGGALATALSDGKLTTVEIIGVVCVAVVAAGAVFTVPNAASSAPPDTGS